MGRDYNIGRDAHVKNQVALKATANASNLGSLVPNIASVLDAQTVRNLEPITRITHIPTILKTSRPTPGKKPNYNERV